MKIIARRNKHPNSGITYQVYDQTEEGFNKALQGFKKKVALSGLFRELKERRAYEKPGDKKRRKHRETIKRIHRLKMKKQQRREKYLLNKKRRGSGKPKHENRSKGATSEAAPKRMENIRKPRNEETSKRSKQQ